MSDEPTTPPPDPGSTPDPEVPPAGDPKDWQAEAEKWKHFAREHEQKAKANADAAAKLAEIEAANKSEAERLADAQKAAEERATKAEAELARLRVATSKGLPAELAARLVGATEEELAEDADRLLALVKPSTPETPPPATPGSADGGPQGAPAPGTKTLDEQIAEAKARGDIAAEIALNNRKLGQLGLGASPS